MSMDAFQIRSPWSGYAGVQCARWGCGEIRLCSGVFDMR